MSGYYHFVIPVLALALVYLALPPRHDGKADRVYHLSGKLCDMWTILSSVVVLVVWATCDLNFDGDKLLSSADVADEVCGEECNTSWESTTNQPSLDYNGMPSMDQVLDAISQHCGAASLILGTAMVLEVLQVVAHRTVTRRSNQEEEKYNNQSRQSETIYTLFGRHDSECLLMVYTLLFFTHILMSNDRAGQTFGLIFAEPISAAAGYYRPVSTIRFIEWSIASPTLMSLVGRSIPRLRGTDDDVTKISGTLRPSLVVTVSYIFLSWYALPVEDFFWRWTLIFFSFMGWIFSVIDQLIAWKIDADETADCAQVSDMLLKVQIIVYGGYGVAYLLPLFDGLLDPVAEQAVLCYADATIKITCSAFLAAMRHADALAEAKRAKTKADAIANDLRQIIHDANAPIFALDAHGNITHWNDKLVRLTGATLVDVVGKPLVNYLSRECREEFQEVFDARKRGMKGTEQYHCDMIDATAQQGGQTEVNEGRLLSLLMTATARHDAEGRFNGIIGVGSDLTEVTRIKAVEEKKNQFMAVVSHELKSPLHGIIGLAESLSQSEKSLDRKSHLKMVKSCALRLLDLVSNIMQMSALTKNRYDDESTVGSEKESLAGCGKGKLRKDPIDIPSILNEVCTLVTNATDKGNLPLLNPLVSFENNVSVPGSARLPIVEGDAYKITQVFYNILTNSCKFCTHGSISIDASVSSSRDRLEVSVTDTGVGINPENVKRIFEPFEQESNSSRRSFGGIGLGLAISKQVIELHGGDIFVKSTPKKGSTFTVSLPVTEEAAALAAVPTPEVKARSKTKSSVGSLHRLQCRDSDYQRRESDSSKQVSRGGGTLSSKNQEKPIVVLSVDDDIVNQEVIRSALSDNYVLHVAMNGLDALEYFSTRSKLPDLVLLDVMMPGMDGFEVLKEIREEKKIPPTTLPVIMLSAMEPIDKAIIQSLKSGANDYVSKPFDPDILKARVSTAVEVKRLTQVENESSNYTKLLHNILPIHIVERLILGDRIISERHDSVCMLFCDIVGWTPMSESVPTHQLIDMLNELFSAFDELTEKHNVFKADTIGDAYIVAAGHEGKHGPSDATLRVAEFAMDMLDVTKRIKPPDGMQLQVRIGIHTGPAYSGVVGRKVPKYTFFGDTVNTAARMEQTGVSGCINMSPSAHQALASEVDTCLNRRSIKHWLGGLGASMVERDPIEVKGKGAMNLYLLCPKGFSLPMAKRISKGLNSNASMVGSLGSADLAACLEKDEFLSSFDQNDLLRREARSKDEMKELKDEVEQLRNNRDMLEASKRDAWSEVEVLRLNLLRNMAIMTHGDINKGSESSPYIPTSMRSNKRGSQSSLTSPLTTLDVTAHQVEDLKLQLLVTTKSLMRARQATMAKESEIDEMELQLQRAKSQLQIGSARDELHGSLDLTSAISVGTNSQHSAFMARTHELLGQRERNSGRSTLSSLSENGRADHETDILMGLLGQRERNSGCRSTLSSLSENVRADPDENDILDP